MPQVREQLVSTVDLMPTLLAAAGAAPVAGLAGRPLQPLLAAGSAEWRTYLFSEWHTHFGATNFYPQRAVRTDRYKLIENLLPDEVNPDYADTFRKLDGDATNAGSRLSKADSALPSPTPHLKSAPPTR